ncbi:MFS transporter [Ihubacter massiliensis]|uniref:MDR family MFS transporter n=1 Tax=Ihubacter massiliensis TaxID=1852367 RepID=UPI0020979E50|nr:MDR family MFS transporter [Ihubacter massiliensis]MCO7120784.1 MFS transporter [Ihubacter massiliensis]
MKEKKTHYGLIMAVYLLGIFMGALDTGIVTPARTVIQNNLGVGDNLGVWMITIYTLAYAASIPVMGKLADRAGRKYVYLASIFLFGAGSFLCGLSQDVGSFTMLLISRAIQAIGGGGIVPVATAEFGTTFPKEKRGMALGMVGGVYGIANIFGASAGSAILDLFGSDNWQFIFYVNVPITIFILIAGFVSLPNTKEKAVTKIDGLGTVLLVIMILSLMYGLKNINFFEFISTAASRNVWPFVAAFAVLLPLFILAEKRAEDPVMNLSYFKNKDILVTLILSVMTGVILMGLIFVPQLCENAMKVESGSGGYFVIILGIFAGVGAPVSGKMIDRWGAKPILAIGFLSSLAGSLFLIFVMTRYPGWATVIISLILIGLGIGFTMGTPLNYMMLDHTEAAESNSALATLSLVRSLGTVVAPAIMVGFLSHAGMGVQGDIMELLPKEITVPQLPYATELQKEMKKQNIEGMPDLTAMTSIKIDMNQESDFKIPENMLELMQNSDVTTIVSNTKTFAKTMFDQMTPEIKDKINTGIDKGTDGVESGIKNMNKNIASMEKAITGMDQGIAGMTTAVQKQKSQLTKMKSSRSQMKKGLSGIKDGIGFQRMMKGQLSGVRTVLSKMPQMEGMTLDQMLPDAMKQQLAPPAVAELKKMTSLSQLDKAISACTTNISTMKKKSSDLSTGIKKIASGIDGIKSGINQTTAKLQETKTSRNKLKQGLAGIRQGKKEAQETLKKMDTMKAAVPGAFDTALKNYLKQIDASSAKIESTFQEVLNQGFRQIYATVAVASAIGLLLLLLYRDRRRRDER